jgi:ribosomal protein S12 methylthiotransferase accessory factor
LVDSRYGLIRRILRDPPDTRSLSSVISYSAYLSSDPHHTPWVIDRITGGAALADDERARRAAIGEAVERYCGNAAPDDLPIDSFMQLVRAGAPAVDPEFALYSPTQYGERGFPFVPMTRDLEIAWVSGQNLSDGGEVLVPASLAYVNYFRGAHASEAPTNYPILAGTAAGESLERAWCSALEELFERDAVTLWWLSDAPATAVDPPATGPVGTLLAEADQAGFRISLLKIPSTFDVPVIAWTTSSW